LNIAKYVASIGFNVSTQDIKKVDRALNLVETKLNNFQRRLAKNFSLKINSFDVDQRRLNIALGNALDVASARTVFEVNRFTVDQFHLNRVMTAALTQASRVASSSAPLRPSLQTPAGTPRSSSRSRAYAGVGGIGLGLVGPLGYGALALAGGGYGLGALNRRNQEVVSAQLQSQAVVQQAGGTAEEGQASFQYLRSEANRIGFNYLDASADYNKLISGLTGSGVSVRESQRVFSGFAELARVNKLDKVTQNRLFRALSQVAGKGKLQAEELTGQIAEALPGGTALFAQAYQAQRGGSLTGQAAISKLMADMKKGLVTSDILTFAATQASLRAAPGLSAASQASQAEQQRYQNAVSDIAVVASDAGVEEGFARIFRTLNAGLSESDNLVKGLAEGFNDATKFADDLLLFPQSFIRLLEGRDSLIADWLGVDTTRQLVEDWKNLKEIWTQISNIKAEDIFGDFLPSLESTSRELASIINFIAQGKNLLSGNLPTERVDYNSVEKIDPFGTGAYASPAGLASAAFNNFLVGVGEYGDRKERINVINDPNSIYYNDPAGYDQMQKDSAMAAASDRANNVTTNQISLTLNVDAVTLGQINIEAQAQQLAQSIALNLEQVLVQFPQKE